MLSQMQVVVSATLDPNFLSKIANILKDYSLEYLLSHILVTPIFAPEKSLQIIKKLKNEFDATVYFDSGGYYVQQGKIGFKDLCLRLIKIYKENTWADWFVLPDNPPTSSDTYHTVEMKVRETVTAAKTFYEKLPNIKEKFIPVVHGHTINQACLCIEAYEDFEYVGFGSFGTSGKNSSVNHVTYKSAEIVRFIAQNTEKLHVFGVSTPPAIYLFYILGVYSFDSVGWLKSAGFGKIFFPFVRAYSISHRSMRYSSLSRNDFEQLKILTDHECPFCEDFRKLQMSRLYKALHNLVVMHETVELIKRKSQKEILEMMSKTSDKYYKMILRLIDHDNTTSSRISK